MTPMLNIAIKAARRAGKIILRYADQLDQVQVKKKGRNDFVSEVDRMAEDDIIETIRRLYPDHSIVAEESGGVLSTAHSRPVASTTDPDQQPEWIIDPLDGTTNYLHGHPQYAVSIAVRHRGELQHGVIFDPLRDEIYTASRGQGAQLNNRRIHVSYQPKLERSLLATGFPFRQLETQLEPWMRSFRKILPRVSDVRRGGSAALDLAYVACGRLDGYWESGLQAWDIAAGSLLVREAGGLVADERGQQNFLETGGIIAANQMIFNDLLLLTLENSDTDS